MVKKITSYDDYMARHLHISIHKGSNKYKKYLKKQAKKQAKKNKPKQKRPRVYYLYAIRLENNRYYVGLTSYKNAIKRYEQHVAGKGAKWTKINKPIELLEVRCLDFCTLQNAIEAENKMTREYMLKHGLYNVRGGDLCQISANLVAKHFNDPVTKTSKHKENKVEKLEEVQERIASELSWIT